jgi:tetratricopeptide (TPR) repeat protein
MKAVSIEQAREALRLAEDDPERAVELASEVVRQAMETRQYATAAVAERALGLAAVHLHDLDTAVGHLRSAVRLGRRTGSAWRAAEARMTLAFALNRRGRPRQALREIDAAILDLDGVKRARAQAQRGAMLHQLGRFDEALASYQTALPTLRRSHDRLWMLRTLLNRGLLHSHRQQFAAAETDLYEAERLASELDLGLQVAFVQQNLSEVNALRGDVPVALHYLDLAEQRFRALHSQVGSVLADRSQLLLSVRLVSEAREAAEQAVEAFERERRRIALPEVRLLLANVASLDGDSDNALRQARWAVREFTRQQRPQWAALARFVVLQTRVAADGGARVGLPQLERTADALVAGGWPGAAIEARLLAAELSLARGLPKHGYDQLRQASRARRRGPATIRARAWYAEARLRLARGNRRSATAAVRAGLRVLDDHRATLGATDLRAHASGHRGELAGLGLRIALAQGSPQRVLTWAEQGRASHLLLRPVRPPDDPALVGALGELRATIAEIDEQRSSGRSAARLVQHQVALERKVRDYCRQQRGSAGPPIDPVPLRLLGEALGGAALLEFIQLDDELHVVVVADGRIRLRQLGPLARAQRLVDSVPFALRRLARPYAAPESRSASLALLRHAAAGLDNLLLRDLAEDVGDRPLVLVPTGLLQSLPWSILPSLAGRPVTVSPSASLWYAANRRPQGTAKPVVVAGYGPPGALAEAEKVAAIYQVNPLIGPTATVDTVTRALDGAGLAHLAAHGQVRAHNPLFSSLRLADGPLTVYDLERLERVPRMVVLAACDSGRTVVCAGDELLGISATLLSHGAQQIVASVVPVPDAETTPLMVAFHQLMVDGHPAPTALAYAQQRVAGDGAAAIAAAAGFVCIGAEFMLQGTGGPAGAPVHQP